MFDTLNWKEFSLSRLFEIETTKSFDKKNLDFTIDGDCDFVGRSSVDNGIQGKMHKLNIEPNNSETFSLVQIGENVAIWRERPWYASQNIFKLTPKVDEIKRVPLFVKAAIDKSMSIYNDGVYTSYPTKKSLFKTNILLPSTLSGEPDWNFMEQYIAELEEERVTKLEAYLVSAGLDDYELTEEDREVLDVSPKWGKFRIGDLFEKKTVKGFPKKIAPNIYDFVSTNGFRVYGQNIKRQYDCLVELPDEYLYEVTTPILAYTSSVGEIGMVEESFYRSGDNGAFQALIPLFDANTYNIRYMLAILRKIFANFEYGTSMQNIKELKFKLPILHDGTPDFEYMEKYIRAIEKLTIQGIVEWNAKELKQ